MALDQVDVDQLEQAEKEMSFLDHLEELRWHIIRSLIAIVGIGTTLFIFNNWLFEEVIFAPSRSEFISYKWICNLSNFIF